MMKNLMVLVLLTWVSLSHAKSDFSLSKETLKEAEAYKLENPAPVQEANRGVAGTKIKKKKTDVPAETPTKDPSDAGSEVRYWQYSE